MKRKMTRLAVTLGVLVMLAPVLVALGQGPDVEILMPVTGRLTLVADDTQLMVVDTASGETSDVGTVFAAHASAEHWDIGGTQLAFLAVRDIAVYDSVTKSSAIAYTGIPMVPFRPIGGWDASGTRILGLSSFIDWDYEEVQILDIQLGERTTILHYDYDAPIPQISDRLFYRFVDMDWNPVYDEWVVINIDTFDLNSQSENERFSQNRVLVYNIVTGQVLHLNDLFSEVTNTFSRIRWSPDGNYLFMQTGLYSPEDHRIIEFVQDESGPSLRLAASAAVDSSNDHRFVAWFGVEDMLLLAPYNQETSERKLSIAQIIDGELYMMDVLRIPEGNVANLSPGDWHLDADQAERRALSCLFDQTLPAQLAVGMAGRVTVTDGTPTRLRSAADLYSEQVTLMAEGTPFTVLDGPTCADGYRWWQLQLDDGTTGWAAEASTDTYFLEPDTQSSARVTTNLQALYTFDEGGGLLINDVSGVGSPMDLTIEA
jgi:hypothetical protein